MDVLSQHHHDLDGRLAALVAGARAGDALDLRTEWNAFERELLRHLELEEAEILPAFAKHDAAEARAILAEHAAIRNSLLDIGLNLDLHLVRAEAVEAFVQQLKRHAHREDTALYAWAKRHVDTGVWHAIKQGLRDVAARARAVAGLGDRVM